MSPAPTQKKGDKKRAFRHWGGPRALAAALDPITKPIFARRGLADGAIANDWPLIVGEMLAAQSAPEKITNTPGHRRNGTLHLRIAHGGLAVELQHLEPLILERINSFFGYRAVGRLRLIQAPLPPRPKRNQAPLPSPPLNPAEESILVECVDKVDDPDLRDALEALGRAVLGDHQSAKKNQ